MVFTKSAAIVRLATFGKMRLVFGIPGTPGKALGISGPGL
jgi:hypothetical protein